MTARASPRVESRVPKVLPAPPGVIGRASGGVSSGCQLSTTARGGPTQGREHCKLGNVVFSKPVAPLSSTTQTYSVEIMGLLVGVPPSS